MQTNHLLLGTLCIKLHQHGGHFGSSLLPGQLVHSVGFQKTRRGKSYTRPYSRAMSSELRVVASVAKLTRAASLSQASIRELYSSLRAWHVDTLDEVSFGKSARAEW